MAFPLIPAALVTAGKAIAGSKLGIAAGKALGLVKGAMGGGKAATGVKSVANMPGVLASPTTRMAGTKLANAAAGTPAFSGGVGKTLFGDMTKQQIGMRLAPDLMFGGLAGVMTPGDLGDKLIAGSTQAIGGGLGGVALGRAAGRFGENAGFLADMAGSIGGDYAGMAVGDTLMRGKDSLMGGSGQTPYERMSAEQQLALEEQIRNQALAGAGLIPGFQQQYG